MKGISTGLIAAIIAVAGSSNGFATLTTFQTFSGANYGVSTSGWGSSGSSGTILTSVPVGATLVSAYLYSGYLDTITPTVTLNGTNVTFGSKVNNATACCGIGSVRGDVTSIVQAALTSAGGPSAVPLSLRITEGNTAETDGEMLVSVYKFASGADNTVAILDGFASVTGDTAIFNLGAPSTASTFAEMMIGDNFSCCGQTSTIRVNATLITSNAGNNDDCTDANAVSSPANGCLITVGTDLNNDDAALSDPFSALNPSYTADHERYNLSPFIPLGATQITVTTANATQDDNIFAAVFKVSGDVVVISGTPEPAAWLMFGTGMVGLGLARLKRRN